MSDFHKLLKRYWGYDSFRGVQLEIIESIFGGKDTLGLMPTGGGKSLTFQVPALAMEGTCIVITPLVALMKDQVSHLRKRYIQASCIHAEMQHSEVMKILENAVNGGVKILYVSPERLSSELFRTKLRHMKVSFICVDEAHCISQWGYDFRPSYLTIAEIRNDLPDIPILALTATATLEVIDDIQRRLDFKKENVFRMSFERKNLAYVVRYADDKDAQLVHILSHVPGSAIVYARSRQRTKEIADILQKHGLQATFFHAGLDDSTKDQRQSEWFQNKYRIMVATNAFGMGIDKADVRLVIHIDCPDSIEAYFQEAGRAGRDGKKSYAVLLYNDHDPLKLSKRISDTFPSKEYIRKVYDCLAYFYEIGTGSGYNATFEFNIDKFCRTYGFFPIQVDSALKILSRAGYIDYTEERECQARVMFALERDELYRLRGNQPDEDAVIVALLRCYSGLFVDFTYIDEAYIAQQVEKTRPEVYAILKNLSHKNIIRYVPEKRTSFVRYCQRREDGEYISIPPSVYEDLQSRMQSRIDAMITYLSTDNQCRSRQLLRYFGEEAKGDCGQCDVCLSRMKEDAEEHRKVAEEIIQRLQDGKSHPIADLSDCPYPTELVEHVAQELVEQGRLIHDDGTVRIC